MPHSIRRTSTAITLVIALLTTILIGQTLNASPARATSVPADAQANAQALLNSGRVAFGHPEPRAQIEAYAAGVKRNINGRDCHINGVLLAAVKTVVVDRGFSIRISSLNRYCEMAGSTSSYHYRNGGGHAIDINRVNGVGSTGGTAQDIALINAMASVLPTPAGLGQYGCAGHNVSLPAGWVQFADACNHNHFEYRGVDTPGAPPVTTVNLSEIGPYPNGWQKVSMAQTIQSNVFSAVNMGRGWGDVISSSGGRMLHTFVNNGNWITLDSGIPLNATSISAVNVGESSPRVFAVENGQVFMMWGDASGWHKAWTGVNSNGKLSAVAMDDGSVQVMINEGGILHQMWAGNGTWVKASTERPVGDQFDAVNMGGGAPQVMTVLNGQIHQIWAGDGAWVVASTGITVDPTVGLTAVNMGGWHPQVFTAEGGTLYQTWVSNGAWTRQWANVPVNGPLDAVNLNNGQQPRVYTTG